MEYKTCKQCGVDLTGCDGDSCGICDSTITTTETKPLRCSPSGAANCSASPGPWYATNGHEGEKDRWGVYRKEEPHYTIAVIENGAPGDTLDTEEATANLIAAAPELLKALESIRDMVGGESEDPDRDLVRMQDIASDAIKKSMPEEGRSSGLITSSPDSGSKVKTSVTLDDHFHDEFIVDQSSALIGESGKPHNNGIMISVKCKEGAESVNVVLEYQELKSALADLESDRRAMPHLYV